MKISNLQQLFEHTLRDLYSAETQIIDALPKMIDMAADEKLIEILRKHLGETKEQLTRLETISKRINFKTENQTCEGIKGILEEGEKVLKDIDSIDTKNAAIIASAQKVEHYEISTYGTAIEYAEKLDHDDEAKLLKDSIDEEKNADEALNGLAKGGLFNPGLNEEAIA